MKRGSLIWVNLEEVSPPEFGKIRPAIVISNSEQNLILPTLVVIPVSSRPPHIWPLRLEFEMPQGNKSYAVVPGIRQISKMRVDRVVGQAPQALMDELSRATALYLSD